MEKTVVLDKAYADKPLNEALDAPISALKGVSEADAKHLATSLNIKTIRDMATNKFFLRAQEIFNETTTHP